MTSMKERGRYNSFVVSNSSIAGVFGYMFLGLLITFAVAFGFFMAAANEIIPIEAFMTTIFISLFAYIILTFVGTFVMARTQNKVTSIVMYSLYCAVLGLVLSSIFVTFEITDIIYAVGVTAAIFGIMALYGYFTKRDLSSFGSVLFMFLLGAMIMSLINIFFISNTLYWIINYIVLAVVIGYVAYDVNLIKRAAREGALSSSLSVFLAFNLFTDFISIFLRILMIIARNRD